MAGAGVLRAVLGADVKALREALEEESPDAADQDGRTVLMLAASEGREDLVEVLLEKGADADSRWRYELASAGSVRSGACTAAMLAADRGHAGVLRLILGKRPDLEERDAEGRTALWLAILRGHDREAAMLLEAGADAEAEHAGLTPLTFAILENRGSLIRALVERGADPARPLLHAARTGDPGLAAAALAAGAGPDSREADGATALMWAARLPDGGLAAALLDAGADPDRRDQDGRTALMWAAYAGGLAAARVLVERGAKLNERDLGGGTAAGHARLKGFEEVYGYLVAAGGFE